MNDHIAWIVNHSNLDHEEAAAFISRVARSLCSEESKLRAKLESNERVIDALLTLVHELRQKT